MGNNRNRNKWFEFDGNQRRATAVQAVLRTMVGEAVISPVLPENAPEAPEIAPGEQVQTSPHFYEDPVKQDLMQRILFTGDL